MTHVSQSWRDIMKDTNDNPYCHRAYKVMVRNHKQNYLSRFIQLNQLCDEVQKQLDQFLEKKREQFNRFFFLSNEELLLILSEGQRDPLEVQPHLRKCFENIAKLDIRGEDVFGEIYQVRSAEGEKLQMPVTVKTRQPVEQWMGQLEAKSNVAVSKALKSAIEESD